MATNKPQAKRLFAWRGEQLARQPAIVIGRLGAALTPGSFACLQGDGAAAPVGPAAARHAGQRQGSHPALPLGFGCCAHQSAQ